MKKEFASNIIKAVGIRALQGKRGSMEDTHTIIMEFMGCREKFFAGLYDGHGGTSVANYAKEHLHEIFERRLRKDGISPSAALRQAFIETDECVERVCPPDEGATAVVAYVDGKHLYVAGVGDSRGVLDRNGSAHQLTRDHKADVPEERKRIEKAGGAVYPAVNGGAARLVAPWLTYGIAVARALGDSAAGKIVSPEPDVQEIILDKDDANLILACDGLWDVVNSQEAVDLIRNIEEPEPAADTLAQEALDRGSGDNISVVIAQLDIQDQGS